MTLFMRKQSPSTISRSTLVVLLAAASLSSCQGPDNSTKDKPTTDSTATTTDSTSWALVNFEKVDSVNPVLQPGTGTFTDPIRKTKVAWEEKDVFNPAIVVKDNKVYMLYRAQDKIGKPGGTSRVGLAVSTAGYHFTRQPEPVLFPNEDAQKKYEWEGGCEAPRV